MITFNGGPAHGVVLQLRRAPVMLRVVKGAGGDWDALDQLDDRAKPGEQIFVYVRDTGVAHLHVCRSPRSASGWVLSAEYIPWPSPPQDDVLRDNARWAAWCDGNWASIVPKLSPDVQRGLTARPAQSSASGSPVDNSSPDLRTAPTHGSMPPARADPGPGHGSTSA